MKSVDKEFLRIIEKRIRRYARINKLFRKNQKILVKGALNRYFVSRIIKNLKCKIYYQQARGVNKIVIPWTLDDEINLFLNEFLTGKKTKQNPKHIKLLKVITDKEAARFAKLNKLRFVPNKKNKDVQKFIEKMTERYSDTKYKLYKSSEVLKCILKQS